MAWLALLAVLVAGACSGAGEEAGSPLRWSDGSPVRSFSGPPPMAVRRRAAATPEARARLAAELGDFERAVELLETNGTGERPDRRLDLGVVLTLRHRQGGAVSDLLAAAEELLAAGEGEVAACNLQEVLRGLPLAERRTAVAGGCSRAVAAPPEVEMATGSPPDHLAAEARADLLALVADGNDREAAASIRGRARAWRRHLEGPGLASYLDASAAGGEVAGLRRVADLYSRAADNPQIAAVYRHADGLSAGDRGELRRAVEQWNEGRRLLGDFRAEEAQPRLLAARVGLARLGSPLLPTVDLHLAACSYHLGDNAGMARIARQVGRRTAGEDLPWVRARALWLEAVALQGEADWQASLPRIRQVVELFERLGEPTTQANLEALAGVAYEALASHGEAEAAYLSAARRLAENRDERSLAGTLSLFARHQARQGRVRLALELQREALSLDRRGGTPALVVESSTLVAERLIAVERYDLVAAALAEAERRLPGIASDGSRRRAEALLRLVSARAQLATDPRRAIASVNRHLGLFSAIGERFYRIEGLLLRARAKLALGDLAGGEADLETALVELSEQGGRIEGHAASVVFLDQAREALDDRVRTGLASAEGGWRALAWVERLRASQLLGRPRGDLVTATELVDLLPPGACVTVYHALPEELLAWTLCGGGERTIARSPVVRSRLRAAVERFRQAAVAGDLDGMRDRGRLLSSWLVAPLGDAWRRSAAWIVVPDFPISGLPFSLLSEDRAGDAFVFERRSVALAPSLVTVRPATARVEEPRLLAIGDPQPPAELEWLPRLPGAAAEASAVASRFPGAVLLTGAAASRTALLESAGRFDVLHLAAHVAPASEVPFGSRLVLAGGQISAAEVAGGALGSPRLVVVAGCSSAAGFRSRLSGSLDMARAFSLAGASDVVAALWDLPDEGLEGIMMRFYEQLAGGASPAEALRAARLARLREAGAAAARDPLLAALEVVTSRLPAVNGRIVETLMEGGTQ